MSKQPTCEERIADRMAGREEYVRKLQAIVDNGPATFDEDYDDEELTEDEAQERLDELPLSVEPRRFIRILLSTGGPGDWLDAEIDVDGTVTSVSYHFNDWFDHAERPVHSDSALWRYAESMAEYVSFAEDHLR